MKRTSLNSCIWDWLKRANTLDVARCALLGSLTSSPAPSAPSSFSVLSFFFDFFSFLADCGARNDETMTSSLHTSHMSDSFGPMSRKITPLKAHNLFRGRILYITKYNALAILFPGYDASFFGRCHIPLIAFSIDRWLCTPIIPVR